MPANDTLKKLFAELGIQNPPADLEQKVADHFSKVMLETVIRHISEQQAAEIEQIMEKNPEDLESTLAGIAATIPGLGLEMEAAVTREYGIMKNMLANLKN